MFFRSYPVSSFWKIEMPANCPALVCTLSRKSLYPATVSYSLTSWESSA